MGPWLSESLRALSDNPGLQAVIAALFTFILEDPTTVGCALLVADGLMGFPTALLGLSIGIALGDWGLYALGRFLGPKTVRWGLVTQHRLDRAGAWFGRNLVVAIFVSRFIPGLRLPTNIGAGMIHTSPARYLPVALLASLVWTFVTLGAISKLGELALPYLGVYKWPIGLVVVLALVLVQIRSLRRMDPGKMEEKTDETIASVFEFWPPAVFYAPVAVYYAWLALRYRSWTLPTVANPSIYSGGVLGESKSDILDLLPGSVRPWVAPHAKFRRAPGESGETSADRALELIARKGFSLPIVAKPDRGQRGLGVQPIYHRGALEAYLEAFPVGHDVVLQELVPYSEEAGIMYYRLPGENRGRIPSITLKHFPFVTGDGRRTLRELIESDERARLLKHVYFPRHEDHLDRVLGAGERFQLVFAGNHKQGCIFRDGLHILSPALEARIHEIAEAIPEYYFGRFDIRFEDQATFQRGEGFKIVEINGAAAEATHIWDPNARLVDAYRVLFQQFRVLFEIGEANRRNGHRPLGVPRFLKDFIAYHRIARKYPPAK